MKKYLLALIGVLFLANTALAHSEDFLNKVSSGKMKYLNKAFLLLQKSDGADAEDLDIALGKSITKAPKNFLLALKKHRSHILRMDALLGNFGDEYVDKFDEQKKEAERRIKSLLTVTDKNLIALRNECLFELQKQIKELDPH